MMEIEFPDPVFLATAFVAGAIALGIAAALLTERMQLHGTMSWVLYLLLAPTPVLYSYTLAGMILLPNSYALPPMVLVILLGTFTVHTLLPAVLPDFQTDTLSSSVFLGFILGVVFLIAGLLLSVFPDGFVPVDQQNLFGGRGTEWQDRTPGAP